MKIINYDPRILKNVTSNGLFVKKKKLNTSELWILTKIL